MKDILFFDIGDSGIVIYSSTTKLYEFYESIIEKKEAAIRLIKASKVVSFNGEREYFYDRKCYDFKQLTKFLGKAPVFEGRHIDIMYVICRNDSYRAFFGYSLLELYQAVFNLSELNVSEEVLNDFQDGEGIQAVKYDVYKLLKVWNQYQIDELKESHRNSLSIISE